VGRTRLEPSNERKDERIDMTVTRTTKEIFERFKHELCYPSFSDALYALLLYYYEGKKPESLCPNIKVRGGVLS
jgi:hypothetical protein